MNVQMDEQKIFGIVGNPIFGWIISKLMDRGLVWLKRKSSDKDEFVEIVQNVINKYPEENLKQEYFISLFLDQKVKVNLNAFEEGKEEISQSLLTESINRIFFDDFTNKRDISLKIMEDLFEEIKTFIFNDPYYANRFAYSVMKLLEKSIHSYGQNIVKSLYEIDKKMDAGFSRTDEGIAQILNEVRAFTKLQPLEETQNSAINSVIKIANDFMNEGKIISARKIYLDLLPKIDSLEKELLWRINSNIGKTFVNEFDELESVKYFEAAYNFFPNDPKGLIQLAYARLLEHDTTNGIKIVENILQNQPDSAEALVVKCNFQMLEGKYSDAIDTISKTKLDSFETLYTYAFLLNKNGNNDKAKEYVLKALEIQKHPIAYDLLAVSMIDPLMESYNKNKPLHLRKDDNIYLIGCEALKHLNEALGVLGNREEKKQLALIYHNRGVVFSLLQDFNKALRDFEKSIELGLNEGIVYLNLGTAYLHCSIYDKAEGSFIKAMEFGESLALNYLINVLLVNNKLPNAKELILQNVRGDLSDLSSNNLMCYLILAEIYERELNDSESNKIISTLRKKYPENILILEREVAFISNHGDIGSAINILEDYLKQVTVQNDFLIFILADLYFHVKNWGKSTELLYGLLSKTNYGPVEKRYLFSLTNQGKYPKALEFITELESSINCNVEEIQRIKGDIFLSYEKFLDSKEIFKILATNFRKSEYYIKWGLSEFRIGELEIASVVLSNAVKDFKDKPHDLLRISSAYSYLSKTKEALDIAFNLLQDFPNDLDTVKNYLMIFLSHTHQFPDAHVDNQMKIAFKENIDSFEDKFPGDKSWQKMEVGDNFEELKIMLHEQEKYLNKIILLHDFHRLPLSMVSKLLRKNIYQTWAGFINRTDRTIWSYSTNNSKKEYNFIRSYCSEIVLEPVAFFTLYNLNQIDSLSRFSRCFFPQRLLDVLMHEVNQCQINKNSGLLTVFSLNGQLYKNEVSIWEIESYMKKLLEMIEFLKGKTFGFEAVENKHYSEDKFFNSLDDTSKQAIQFSIERNIPLLIDEATILEFFQAKYNLQGFSTLTFLRVLRADNKITTQGYNSLLLKLISGNYHFISLNADIIKQGLKENNFKMSFETQYIFKYLNQPDIDERSVASVLGDLFMVLYSEDISTIVKNTWIDYALDCLPRNRINTTALLKFLFDWVSNHYNGVVQSPFIINWLDDILRSWALSRAVPYFK